MRHLSAGRGAGIARCIFGCQIPLDLTSKLDSDTRAAATAAAAAAGAEAGGGGGLASEEARFLYSILLFS